MSGVVATGFEIERYEDIRAAIEVDQRANIAPNLVTDDSEALGQVNGIFSRKIAELWELGRTLAGANDPRAAVGFLLRALSALTGTKPKEATYSRVAATVNLNAGATLPAGSFANVAGYSERVFKSEATATNPGLSAANIPAVFVAQLPGPVAAPAGTLTVITAPVLGWNSVTNATDAELGQNEETDVELRVRRLAELASQGSATVDGIRADLLAVLGVIDVGVLENTRDLPFNDGFTTFAGHSVSALLWDGSVPAVDDDDFALALFLSKAAGIETNGNVSVVVQDQQGNSHTSRFRRITQKEIYLRISATYDPAVFDVTNGVANVKAAILARAEVRQLTGRDVIAEQYTSVVIAIPGIEDITNYRHQSGSDPGVGVDLRTTIAISPVEIAKFDSTRITVTLTPASTL